MYVWVLVLGVFVCYFYFFSLKLLDLDWCSGKEIEKKFEIGKKL